MIFAIFDETGGDRFWNPYRYFIPFSHQYVMVEEREKRKNIRASPIEIVSRVAN
jgi:hypothetical protein